MFEADANELAPDRRIDQARDWALKLWDRIAAEPGENKESAMHHAARLAKVSPGTVWSFRYRPPKKLDVTAYFSIRAAYERHVASVEATLAQNLVVLRSLPATASRDRLVAQMEEFLGNQESDPAGTEAEETFDQSQGWGR
jgi:hypothetical protein